MITCKNCGHEHEQGQLCYKWYEPSDALRHAHTYCGCTNPEPFKFKVGDIIQLKDDIAQIGLIEEIGGIKYVYDFEGKSYIELANIIDKCFELKIPEPKEAIINDN